VEDPGQHISLLNAHPEDYDDDASLSDGGSAAIAETAFDSPVTAAAPVEIGECPDRAATAASSQSETGSSTTGVKERPQSTMKLPLDQTDYLQPQSSLPATYLDLVPTPGKLYQYRYACVRCTTVTLLVRQVEYL